MYLHNDKAKFSDLINEVKAAFNVNESIIEKDYFVTLFLKGLIAREPNIIFKGGTALSKCYHIIERFSEDIDINIKDETSQNRRKDLKDYVIIAAEELGMKLTNPEKIVRWQNYNKYKIAYPTLFPSDTLNQQLLLEAVFRISSFPTEIMPVNSLIYDYLKLKAREDIASEYGLMPFDISVQSLERTFVDKVYALCDYYLEDNIERRSRHLYDLYKILPNITLSRVQFPSVAPKKL